MATQFVQQAQVEQQQPKQQQKDLQDFANIRVIVKHADEQNLQQDLKQLFDDIQNNYAGIQLEHNKDAAMQNKFQIVMKDQNDKELFRKEFNADALLNQVQALEMQLFIQLDQALPQNEAQLAADQQKQKADHQQQARQQQQKQPPQA